MGVETTRKSRLHQRYAELSRLPDASRLAYLNGPERSWSITEVADLWTQADAKGRGTLAPLNNLYLHVPFCKSICTFCNYERLRPSSPKMLEEWEERLFRTIDALGPAARHLTFHALYVGGGTPSVLPPKQLDRVLQRIRDAFEWHPKAGRHFEFDPAILNAKKLDVLHRHGVTHYSFGIQTLKAEVNVAHNRGGQSLAMVEKRFEEFKERKIHQVSCDFLAGLAGTQPEDILDEVETIVGRFSPAWIDVFMITPTSEYVDGHFNGSYDAFFSHLEPFQRRIPEGLARIAKTYKYDFLAGQGHHLCLQRRDKSWAFNTGGSEFGYTQLVSEARVPINLLGLGPSSRSHIFGVASFQNDASSTGPIPTYQGYSRTIQSEAVTFLAHDLRDTDQVDREHFVDLFGEDICTLLPTTTEAWADKQLTQATPKTLQFIPQDRQARTRALLWLVEDEHLEHEISKHMALDLSTSGMAKLLSPLPLQTKLSGGAVLAAVSHGHVHLRLPGQEIHKVRITPPLDNESPPGVVILTAPEDEAGRTQLLQAVQQLHKLIRRNHHPWVPDSD